MIWLNELYAECGLYDSSSACVHVCDLALLTMLRSELVLHKHKDED